MKKLWYLIICGLLVAIAASVVYVKFSQFWSPLDSKLRDYMFLARGPIKTTGDVVLVDIDEKSLGQLGQWPWERNKVSKIIENLTKAEVGIIGFDVVFAEADKSSPSKVLKELGMDNSKAPDYDAIFAKSVGNSPVILGYVLLFSKEKEKSDKAPTIPAIFVEKNKPEREFLLNPLQLVLNIDQVQGSAYSSGFFNTSTDESGIIHCVPLAAKYMGAVYPSLTLEMLRVATDTKKVVLEYDESGVIDIKLNKLDIPTDRFGRICVNFRGPQNTIKYISAADIYNGKFDKKDIAGKFIIIGASAAGLLDLRATPFDVAQPGMEVHANIIDNALKGDFIYKPLWADGADLSTIALLSIVPSIILGSLGAVASFAFLIVAAGGFLAYNFYMLFSEGIILNILVPLGALFASFFGALTINYLLETRQKEFIKAKFSKKVSPAVVEDLLKQKDLSVLEGVEKNVTIFFSDIRGFTSLSEAMKSPKELISVLNSYMTPMAEIIAGTSGTIDKFIGDAIMAYWNAPNNVPNHEDAALKASIAQIKKLKDVNEMLTRLGKPNINIGIGLNTGVVTVGEMGSEGRADYTIIGDHVNLASRLEGLNKPYGSHIILSEFTKAGLKDKYLLRDLDIVRVKGKEEPVKIYEAFVWEEDTEEFRQEMKTYEEALHLYRTGSFAESKRIFDELYEKDHTYLYKVYSGRCDKLIELRPENFDGVFTFETK